VAIQLDILNIEHPWDRFDIKLRLNRNDGSGSEVFSMSSLADEIGSSKSFSAMTAKSQFIDEPTGR
jgi:hypothetical protein